MPSSVAPTWPTATEITRLSRYRRTSWRPRRPTSGSGSSEYALKARGDRS